MSAWTLVKLGKTDVGLKCISKLLFDGTDNRDMLHNVIDWMGEPAFPLVKKYMAQGGEKEGRYGISIMARIAEVNEL